MDLQYYISSEEASFFINNKMGSSDRIPTRGEYKVGDFIVSNTQENGIFGWVCTVAGIPGTWVEIVIGNSGGIPLDPELIAKINSIGDVTQLQTSNKTNIVNAINELFQSVSSGKQSVANAITDKGVKTLATDSFTTMSNNISKIDTGKDIMVDGKPIDKEFELISVGEKTTIQNSLPYSFFNGSAVVFNNEIHILGGGDSSSDHTKHYKFNGTTWTQVSTLPYKFYYGSAVVFNNEIHILGCGDSISYDKHYKFNGTAWTRVSTLPYNFYQGSAVVFNNEIHILGSSYSSDQTKHYKFNGARWTQVSTLPGYFYNGSAVVFNNEIHILGGAHYSSYTKHHKYNGRSWTASISKLPYNLYYGSAVVYNNEIRILGGIGGENNYYKYNGSSWTQLSTLPYNFYQGSAVVYNNEVHMLGSSYSSDYTKHYKSYMIYIMNIK